MSFSSDDGEDIISDDGAFVPDDAEVIAEESYATRGRVDPTYEPAVQQYHAPVAETRSFGSRFWWLIPLLLLLIVLPFILHRCNRAEACNTLPPIVWTSALQESTWQSVHAIDAVSFTADNRQQVLDGLVYLCNRRLSGATLTSNDVEVVLNPFHVSESSTSPSYVAGNVINLVNGNTFCRCR